MTVAAIEFSRLGPPKLHLYAMKCDKCGELSPWWERNHCYHCGNDSLTEFGLKGTGERTNYTGVYYPPREFLGQEPYVVGHIQMDEGVNMPAPVMGVDPDAVDTIATAAVHDPSAGTNPITVDHDFAAAVFAAACEGRLD